MLYPSADEIGDWLPESAGGRENPFPLREWPVVAEDQRSYGIP